VTTTSSFKPEIPQLDPAAVEEATTRIRELNERFQSQIADASQLEWVSALATTHAQFIKDVSAAYIKAARDTLK
jgi:hypothetical protein